MLGPMFPPAPRAMTMAEASGMHADGSAPTGQHSTGSAARWNHQRAGGMGLITGRKTFQRPFDGGVALLHAVHDVYLDERLTLS